MAARGRYYCIILQVYIGVTLDHCRIKHISKIPKRKSEQETTSSQTKNFKMGSHSNHTQVVRSSAMLVSCRVRLLGVGALQGGSTHAKKLDATLNETCRMITGCLKPTNTNSLPVLAGIAPSDIRRAVASRTERTRQATDQITHSMDIAEWCHA